MYTARAHDHKSYYDDLSGKRQAVGICAEPARIKDDEEDAEDKILREKHFPLELLEQGFDVTLQHAQASEAADKEMILEAMKGKEDELNDMLRGRFAAVALRPLLEQGKSVEACLKLLETSRLLELTMNFKDCSTLTPSTFNEILTRLPHTLRSLNLARSDLGSQIGPQVGKAIAEYVHGLSLIHI